LSVRLRPRAFLLLGAFLPLALALRADDHIRTGGQYQEPYPYGAPGSVIRTDQRFHPGDPTPSSNYIYLSCHAGDVIQNPAATNTFIDVVIPAGINLTWNQSIPGGPQITWPGTGAKVIFQNFPNTKTIRLKITSDFTPIADNFNLSNIGFNTVGLLLSTPCGPGNLVDNVVETAGTIAHIDDATIRVSEYCSAGPGGGFANNQVISPGTTVTMDPITITETSTAANRGIWALGAGPNFDNGIRITIPSGTGVTFNSAIAFSSPRRAGPATRPSHSTSVPAARPTPTTSRCRGPPGPPSRSSAFPRCHPSRSTSSSRSETLPPPPPTSRSPTPPARPRSLPRTACGS
jgi:hypothetical protein